LDLWCWSRQVAESGDVEIPRQGRQATRKPGKQEKENERSARFPDPTLDWINGEVGEERNDESRKHGACSRQTDRQREAEVGA
jgi:hypothetical protein